MVSFHLCANMKVAMLEIVCVFLVGPRVAMAEDFEDDMQLPVHWRLLYLSPRADRLYALGRECAV